MPERSLWALGGGFYYVDKDGVKVYLVSRKKPSRNYNPPAAIYRIKSNHYEEQTLRVPSKASEAAEGGSWTNR